MTLRRQDLEKRQTATFPPDDFVRSTVRGPREFDVWCVSIQPCIVELGHGGKADVKGILKTTEQSSSQGSNVGEWNPHRSVKGRMDVLYGDSRYKGVGLIQAFGRLGPSCLGVLTTRLA